MLIQPYPAGPASAQGVIVVPIQPFGGQRWQVQQVSVRMDNAPAGSQCFVNLNGGPITEIPSQNGVASGLPYIEVGAFERMTVEWSGLTPGQTGSIQIYYEVIPEGLFSGL